MNKRALTTCIVWCAASLLAACSYSFSDHPSACTKTSDCASGFSCFEQLCVKGGSAGAVAGSGAGSSGSGGTAGTQAGTSGSGASGSGASGSGTAGTSADVDGAIPDVDAAMMSLDGGDSIDAGDAAMLPDIVPPTCMAWTPPATACPAACTGGCDQGVCKIDCSGIQCITAIVNCPADYACFVSCTGGNSCTSITVNCNNAPCEVLCDGANACTGGTVNCGSDACRLSCANGGAPVTTLLPGPSCSDTRACP